jgi:hypothetical protein
MTRPGKNVANLIQDGFIIRCVHANRNEAAMMAKNVPILRLKMVCTHPRKKVSSIKAAAIPEPRKLKIVE